MQSRPTYPNKSQSSQQSNRVPFSQPSKSLQKPVQQKPIEQKPHPIKKPDQPLPLTVTSQHYTSLNVRLLGNHSNRSKTTFEERYNDPRLKFISPDFFIGKYVLDIGCNEGFVDLQIAMRYFPKQVYGIDIDYKIIKNARRNLMNVVKRNVNYQKIMDQEKSSLQKQVIAQNTQNTRNHVKTEDQNQKHSKQQICSQISKLPLFFQDRLKTQFSLQSYLPPQIKLFTPTYLKPQNKFPLNIKFQPDNIFTIKYQEDVFQYDTVLCLKLTKWIHLAYGDEGIRKLFQKVYDLLKIDGTFVLQAQDWASYKRKKNLCEVYKRNYDSIKYGPNQFQKILVDDPLRDFKFQLVSKIDQNQRKHKNDPKLDYPILIFKKKSTALYY